MKDTERGSCRLLLPRGRAKQLENASFDSLSVSDFSGPEDVTISDAVDDA